MKAYSSSLISIFPIKAMAIAFAGLILQSGASAALLLDFNAEVIGGNPTGTSYLLEPVDTTVRVIDTTSGTPFPADFIRGIQMTDNSEDASAAVAFRDTAKYSSGVASLNFVLNSGYTNIRLGDGGATGNLTNADMIAAQVVLQSVTVDGLLVGRVSVSNSINGALIHLDQTFTLNSVYKIEIAFMAGGGTTNGTYQIFLTEGSGTRTMLTSNSGANSVFDFRGATKPLTVDTIRFQVGSGADIGSSVAFDNVSLIPEPGSVSLAIGGLFAFGWSQWLRARRSATVTQ